MIRRGQNDWVWNKKRQDSRVIHSSTMSFLHEWRHVQALPITTQSTTIVAGERSWRKPRDGYLKCNIDGAVPPHGSKIGFGFVIHYQSGELVATKNGSMDGPTEVIVAEALMSRT